MPNHLRDIRKFPDLVRYLESELEWPVEAGSFDDLTFEYVPAELGLKEEEAVAVKKIHQLRPLETGQPWGVFFVEFEKKKLPVVVLRRILSHLVIKKRASANKSDRAAWNPNDLLFISAFGDEATDAREIAFAHFHQTDGDLPTLKVLGWDGADTPLKLEHVAGELRDKLHWPANPKDHTAWRNQWSRAFRHRLGHTVRTADDLAEVLAALARGIRERCSVLMKAESDNGPLTKLFKAFQAALIHDLTEESFADTYAQTITYGLFTAAVNRTDLSGGAEATYVKADDMALMARSTSPFLKEMLETFLHVGGRKNGVDFDELGIQDVVELLRGDETDLPAILRDFGNRTRGEDPVIHFYEHFLSAYNKKLKIQRGVFYTPQPVVSYIVRSVHELLQTEFGLEDGLASTVTWREMLQRHKDLKLPTVNEPGEPEKTISPDEPFVQILDPATGTATFLVEVVDVIHRTLTAKWKKQGHLELEMPKLWNEYVPKHLLPRLHGYELLAAPYAIAHLKLGLKLTETGYRFGSDERARIYLTNALEPKVAQLPQIGFEPLAHEAKAVNEIKWYKRFTVVIGNPPYSPSICEPAWLMQKVDEWKQGLNETKSDLNREEWKFMRLAQHHCQVSRTGILGFIINRDFLDGIAKRKMREHLATTFPLRIAVDLNGDVKGNIADENVFEIEQGVAISILCTQHKTAVLRYCSIVGERQQKYLDLAKKIPIDRQLRDVAVSAPYFRWLPFVNEDSGHASEEYSKWFPINDAFSVKSSGIQTKNDPVCIGWSAAEILSRVEKLATLGAKEARQEFDINDDGAWSLVEAKKDLKSFGVAKENVRRILYRPFDWRFTYYTHKSSGFLGRPRFEVMQHMIGRKNIGLIFNRQIVGDSVSQFGVSRDLIAHGTFYLGNKGQDYLAPLYLHEEDLLGTSRSNFTGVFLSEIQKKIGKEAESLTTEDIFHYAYGVFHCPGYRSRYAEFLKIDFPRLPLTGNLELFRALAHLGGELVALHLMEFEVGRVTPCAPGQKPSYAQLTEFLGGRAPEVEKVSWSKNTVWIDRDQTVGFKGVREDVWNFHIGGYQVCEKWLKDRKGRPLTAADREHYQKIVVALSETIRLMKEIDAVIETHGGWPMK